MSDFPTLRCWRVVRALVSIITNVLIVSARTYGSIWKSTDGCVELKLHLHHQQLIKYIYVYTRPISRSTTISFHLNCTMACAYLLAHKTSSPTIALLRSGCWKMLISYSRSCFMLLVLCCTCESRAPFHTTYWMAINEWSSWVRYKWYETNNNKTKWI